MRSVGHGQMENTRSMRVGTHRGPFGVLSMCMAIALLVSALVPTAGEAAQTAATSSGELVIGQASTISTMDPGKEYLSPSAGIWHSFLDTLAFRMPDLSIAPGLATSWQLVND